MNGGVVTLADFLTVVRERRLIVFGVTVLFAAVALALAARQDTVYETASSLSVRDLSQDYALIGRNSALQVAPAQLAAQQAEAITRRDVALRVARRLGGATPDELQKQVVTQVDTRTNLIQLVARDGDARRAAQIANAFATEGSATVAERTGRRIDAAVRALDAEVVAARRAVRNDSPGADVRLAIALQQRSAAGSVEDIVEPVSIARRATVPSSPVEPRPVRDVVIGAILGLLVGLLLAFARSTLDRRLRTAAQIQQLLDLPVIGRVSSRVLGTAGLLDPKAAKLPPQDLESFSMLTTGLRFLDIDRPVRSVLLTSSLAEEGKSTVAAGLAASAAQAGRRVLLLEADLRRPSLSGRLPLKPAPGLADYLAGDASPADVLQVIDIPGGGQLVVITAGTQSTNVNQMLQSERCASLLAELHEAYDLIVIDGTPLLLVADALDLVPHVESVLLCVRAKRTTRDELLAAHAALSRAPAKPTAVMVTAASPREGDAYGYYGYAYQQPYVASERA